MSKLVAVLATLFLAAHAAAAFRTITTTTVVTDEQSRGMSTQCQQAVMRVNLKPCLEYLGHKVQEREGGPRFLRESESEERMLGRCCEELKSLESDRCVCEGLKVEMTQATATEPEFVSKIMRVAQDLPGMCKVSPSTCHFPMII